MNDQTPPSGSLNQHSNRTRCTVILVLALLSIIITGLTLIFVLRNKPSDFALPIAIIVICLTTTLLSLSSISFFVREERRHPAESLEVAQLKNEVAMNKRTRELHHDLVNHLSTISTWIQLGDGERAIRYIHEILSTVRLEPHLPSSTDRRGLTLLLGMIGPKLASAEERRIALHLQLDSNWTKAGIRDETAVRVLGNLMDNALHAATQNVPTEAGRVEINITTKHSATVFRVWNNGPPMAKEIQKSLDDSPDETDKTTKRGLGLNIVRELVAEAGGTISIQSAQQTGTEVIVCFPFPSTGVN